MYTTCVCMATHFTSIHYIHKNTGYAVKVNCNNEMQKDSIGINDRLYYPCYIANYNT